MKWTNITAVILLAATMLFSASAPAPGNGLNLPPLAQGASGNSEISVVEAMPSVSMCPGYTRFDIGQEMSGNGYTVRLDDLTVAEGNANTHSAVIEIKDSTGNVLEKAKIAPVAKWQSLFARLRRATRSIQSGQR